MRRIIIYTLLIGFIIFPLDYAQSNIVKKGKPEINYFNEDCSFWVDSVYNSLNEDERIAQLFMIAAYSNKSNAYNQKLTNTIQKYKPGGIIFFQGDAYNQAKLTNRLQDLSKTPLLIGIDGEQGLGSRLSHTIKFPKQMTLGAIQDNNLIYEMGREIGRQFKELGIHINFAPVADINNNPNNPVINTRSFGENKYNVSKKCIAYMNGLQDEGIIAVAKHFPGHGDTNKDSHKTLPIINHDYSRLNNIELYTFRELINNGILGVMTGHISLPKIDPTGKSASLSKTIVTNLLKRKLHFNGICFTDALNMGAICNKKTEGLVNPEAIIAGNDILLFPANLQKAIASVKEHIKNGAIDIKDINTRCKKIIKTKYKCGLHSKQYIYTLGIDKKLNTNKAIALNEKLIANSITLIKNDNKLIPLKNLDKLSIASIALGAQKQTVFQNTLSLYTKVSHYNNNSLGKFKNDINDYNLIIINIYGTDSKYKSEFISNICKNKKVIVNYQNTPYRLSKYKLDNANSIILSYSKDSTYQALAAQAIFGGIVTSGKLPVTINDKYKYGQSLYSKKIRLGYMNGETVNIASSKLNNAIDSLVQEGISKKAFPGCQILIAKDGYVVLNKSYGYFSYNKNKPVKNDCVYDIASITKITSTLPAVMKLYDSKSLKINRHIRSYLSELKHRDKGRITIKQLLLHEAGLKAYIPLFKLFIDKDSLNGSLFRSRRSNIYNLKLAPSLYLNNTYRFKEGIFCNKRNNLFDIEINRNMYMNINYIDTIYNIVYNSKTHNRGKYKYSDLSFVLLKNIIERIKNTPLNEFCQDEFYSKLGANNLTYKPIDKINIERIIPSNYDIAYRQDSIRGYVHDPLAALLGGISGNAGLFSNANDIGKIMTMYLENGTYAENRYINQSTIKKFSSKYHKRNRRGFGFDKPELQNKNLSPSCPSASAYSYGHSGFTGTLTWNDPINNTTFVFLSNRTFPDDSNSKIVKLNLRTRIQEVIYSSIR